MVALAWYSTQFARCLRPAQACLGGPYAQSCDGGYGGYMCNTCQEGERARRSGVRARTHCCAHVLARRLSLQCGGRVCVVSTRLGPRRALHARHRAPARRAARLPAGVRQRAQVDRVRRTSPYLLPSRQVINVRKWGHMADVVGVDNVGEAAHSRLVPTVPSMTIIAFQARGSSWQAEVMAGSGGLTRSVQVLAMAGDADWGWSDDAEGMFSAVGVLGACDSAVLWGTWLIRHGCVCVCLRLRTRHGHCRQRVWLWR